MSHEQDVERARQAQAVIDNPIYTETHAAIEAEIIRQWREARNPADREQLHQLLLMHARGKEALEAVMRSGDVAMAELQRRKSRAEQVMDAV